MNQYSYDDICSTVINHANSWLEESIAQGFVQTQNLKNLADLMMQAAQAGNLEAIRMLVKAGVDINIRNIEKNTVLHFAGMARKLSLLEGLLQLGANKERKNSDGYTALHVYGKDGWSEGVDFLIKHGADVHAKTPSKYTPLMVAMFHTGPEVGRIVDALIDAGASADLKTDAAKSVPELAVACDNPEAVRALLKNGYELSPMGKFASGLHHAVHIRSFNAVDALIQSGCDVNVNDAINGTPLHLICKNDVVFEDMLASKLIMAGADLESKDENGMTPFDCLKLNEDLFGRWPQERFARFVRERAALAASDVFNDNSDEDSARESRRNRTRRL